MFSTTIFRVTLLMLFFAARSLSLAIPFSLVKSAYISSLSTRPMLTNCATAGVLSVCSDFVSQNIEISNQKRLSTSLTKVKSGYTKLSFSFYRSFCMFSYGFFVLGWFVTHWFSFLDYLVPTQGITFPKALKKIAINQICMAPILNGFFFAYVIFTRGNERFHRHTDSYHNLQILICSILPISFCRF